MKRVLLLVEGQTEEQFVKTVLAPHFWNQNVVLQPTIVATRRMISGPDFKGGLRSFEQFRKHLRPLFGDSDAAMITTFLDYYALPADFPGQRDRQAADPYVCVEQLEAALQNCFPDPRFRPFLMLHEFEALLFVDPDTVAQGMHAPDKAQELREIRAMASGPEKINQGPETHPAARIAAAFPRYRKVTDGARLVARIGLPQVLRDCPHYKQWHDTIEGLGNEQ